jgi:hypothetical protein
MCNGISFTAYFKTILKMIVKCKNCLPKEGIVIPDFKQLEKNNLVELVINSPIYAVKYIVEKLMLSHSDAKYIVTHINKAYGKCNRCAFSSLEEEYITCPKCGALNFNWKMDVGS